MCLFSFLQCRLSNLLQSLSKMDLFINLLTVFMDYIQTCSLRKAIYSIF